MASVIDCCSTKDLWNKLSASVLKISSKEVDEELKYAKSQFQNGLLYYKSNMSKSTGDTQKSNDKNLDSLVSKIANMLNLEKNLALKIFENYLMFEYRGAGKSIEDYLADPQLRKRLMMDIWLSYLREQVFLLHCMKLVWVYSKDDEHPYKENFKCFLETIDTGDLLENLILQAEMLVKDRPPMRTEKEVVTQTLIEEWVSCNLWCQILTAQLILEVAHTHPVSPKNIERLFVIYKQQNFGWNPGFQHAMNGNHRDLPKMLTACHISVLVHIIMQLLCLEDEVLISERNMIVKLKDHINMLDVQDNHGLLMMAFSLTLHDDEFKPKDLIDKAMTVNQFSVMYNTLQAVKLLNDFPTENRIFQVMVEFLKQLIDTYGVLTFWNIPMFFEVCMLVLSNSQCNASLIIGPKNSLNQLSLFATAYFPHIKPPLILLVTSLAKSSSEGLKKALNIIEKLDIFTEDTDQLETLDVVAEQDPTHPLDTIHVGESLVLSATHFALDGMLKIPAGTTGLAAQLSSTCNILLHWSTKYNFWDVLCADQESTVATIRSGHSDDLGHSAIVLECIYAVLNAGWHGDKMMTGAIQKVFDLAECFCKMPKPPLELLTIVMKIFTALAEKHCDNVCNSASSIQLIPCYRLYPVYEPTLTAPVSYGIFDYIFNQFECDQGKSQFIQAYIKFLLEIIKHPEVPFGIVVAGIITVSECIFPAHARWQYSTIGDVDELGLLCMKLFHTLLTPLTETQKSQAWQKLCLESLLMSKASPILLEIATTGERYIETLMVEQSTFMAGRIQSLLTKVQLSLSVLNLVLQKKHLLLNNSCDCYLLQQISTSRQIQKNNFYFRLTSYLYSRFHPFLPTLAMKVLQKIFEVIPISLRAYMGIEDNSIRQTFEIRLIAEDDYPPLRAAIIDTIATCVRTSTQSALLEVLFSDENTSRKSLKSTSKDVISNSGESLVLQFLLGVLLNTKNNPYKVSNGIYLSVINLVNTCWEKQIDYLRTRMGTSSNFWENLCAPLNNEILTTTIYPTLYRIVCLELMKNKDNEKLCAELESFILNSCIRWNTFVLKKMKESVTEEEATKEKVIIQAWSTFLVMILKKKLELVPTDVLDTLIKEYIDALMSCLRTDFGGPCINMIAQLLLHLLVAGKKFDFGKTFTDTMSRLLMVLSQKYIYVPTDSRTLILAIVNTGMSCKSFSIDEVCHGESTFILSLSEIILNEVLYVPALTKGHRGSPMLYCCVFQFLKLAHSSKNSTEQSLERIGSTNTLASVMRNATKLIKGREDALCAEVAMNVLVASSQIPALVHYLIIAELPDLFQALTCCKERVTEKQEIEWDGVYSQGVILSSNLINESWIISVPSVTTFVVDHRQHLVNALMFLRRQQDRHALLMALQIGKLLSKVCESKSTWHYIHGESLKELTRALEGCVDLCILFLTRPKICVEIQRALPFHYVEFKHPSEKDNLFMKIAGKCLECLSKITSPEMTKLQEFIQLADDRRQIQVVKDTLKAGPSLARDYQPSLSFGHLNELSNLCVQILLEPQKSNKDAASLTFSEVHSGIAKATLDTCLLFTMQQAKAHMQRDQDPWANAQFRRDIYNELGVVLSNAKYKLNKMMKRAGSHDMESPHSSTSDLQSYRFGPKALGSGERYGAP